MKTKISRIGKRSLSLVLTMMLVVSMMLVGMVPTIALTTNGYIYFRKPSSWTSSKVFLMVGHSTYSRGYEMSLVANTDNLYCIQGPTWETAPTEVAVFCDTSVWGEENSTVSHRKGFVAFSTDVFNDYSFNSNNYYIIPTSGNPTYKGNSASSMNSSQTIGVKLYNDGVLSTPSTAPGTVSLSSYAFNAYNSCSTAKNSQVNKGSTTVSASTSVGYLANTTVTATEDNQSYTFVGWYDSSNSLVSSNKTYTYNPTSTRSLYAAYKLSKTTFTVTPEVVGNGTVSFEPSIESEVEQGSTVTITATPNDGYECTGVTVSPQCDVTKNSDGTYSFTMPANDVTVTVTFKKSSYTINKSVTNGSVDITPSGPVEYGKEVTITNFKPNTGYEFDSIAVVGANLETVSEGSSYKFTMPANDVTVTVVFKQTVVEVPTLTGVTLSSSTATVVTGRKFTLTATPTPGNASCTYVFYKATGETADPTNDQTISSNGNVAEITAEATPGTYKYYVVATDSTDSSVVKTSNVVSITVTQAAEEIETLTVWLKGTTLSSLKPSVSLDGATNVEMTRVTIDNGGYIGTHYTGSYQFYWYEATFNNVSAGTAHTLLFTNGKGMNASISLDFSTCPADGKMYFAVDNMQAGTVAEDITYDNTKKICFRSSVNMITNVHESGDPLYVLQAANIALMSVNNTLITETCYFGDMNTDNTINVKDATAVQKLIAGIESENPSYDVLGDFDCNGVIDIKDATAIQKYSLGI